MNFGQLTQFAVFLSLFFGLQLIGSVSSNAGQAGQAGNSGNCCSSAVCNNVEECWSRLFPKIRASLADNLKVVDRVLEDYEKSAREKIARANKLENESGIDPLQKHLLLERDSCRSYFLECSQLEALWSENKPVDILVEGMSFDENGELFHQTAASTREDIVKGRCGQFKRGSSDYKSCERGVVFLKNPGRERLMRFLSLLQPKSIRSFTYVGHGLENGIVLGERTFDRIPVADRNHRQRKVWEQEDGILYSDHLRSGSDFADILGRAMRPDASVKFLACSTGKDSRSILVKPPV